VKIKEASWRTTSEDVVVLDEGSPMKPVRSVMGHLLTRAPQAAKLLVILAYVLWSPNLVSPETGLQGYEISSIRAYLYHEDSGTLSSQDIIALPKGSLWNTIIGEGAAGSPSHATMVVVEISGKPGSYEPKRKVELIAYERGKNKILKLKKTYDIGVLSSQGRYLAAFWLYDTGCAPIEILAQIIGQPSVSKVEKQIDFECGE
jgi:hypothetical protein